MSPAPLVESFPPPLTAELERDRDRESRLSYILQRFTNVVGDIGGGVGECTIDELTDHLSMDYRVCLCVLCVCVCVCVCVHGERVTDLEAGAEDSATQTAHSVLRGPQLRACVCVYGLYIDTYVYHRSDSWVFSIF